MLAALYERVLVPPAMMHELDHPRTPPIVRAWLGHLPQWLEVRGVRSPPVATLAGLDPGEQQAIQLAQEQHADLLLIDERRGVALARRQGLEVTGTLGVLVQAARLALDQDEQETVGHRRDDEEIGRHDLPDVIPHERAPSLGWRLASAPHVFATVA
jgi:predicted nucleic acid-binding protein